MSENIINAFIDLSFEGSHTFVPLYFQDCVFPLQNPLGTVFLSCSVG